MAVLYKQLGGAAGNGVIGTAANLYSASGTASTSTIVSSIVVCNTSASSATYTIALNTASATYAAGKYVVYQSTIAGNDTVSLALPLIMDPTARYLNVSTSTASVNISAYGSEIT